MAILEENNVLFAHKALTLMPGLTDATRRVAGAIVDHFNKRTGQCDPGIERLAALLGISRPSVIRATNQLHELGLIERISHGGKSHRSRYVPNWDRFRAIVEDWDARMKSGQGPGVNKAEPDNSSASPPPAKVSSLIPSRYQPYDHKGIKGDTQTLRINPSKEPVEPERVETPPQEPPAKPLSRPVQGLGRGSKSMAQRPFLLPINGGRSVSHADAAKAAAERRWYAQLHALGEKAEADVLDWMTWDQQEAATQAELKRRGGGLEFIVTAMQSSRCAAMR